MKNAVVKMDAIMGSYHFTDDKIKAAATAFVENYRKFRPTGTLGHTVGMEVHDVRYPTPTLEPGYVFTIEPAMQIQDEHLGIRLEDMLLITESGYENLSAFVPVEIADIEKLMAKHRGLSDRNGRPCRDAIFQHDHRGGCPRLRRTRPRDHRRRARSCPARRCSRR